jgi:hypothetical protein
MRHDIGWEAVDVVHSPATETPDMVMWVQIAVEPALGPADLELVDGAISSEQFQVAVDGGQADPGQAPANDLV